MKQINHVQTDRKGDVIKCAFCDRKIRLKKEDTLDDPLPPGWWAVAVDQDFVFFEWEAAAVCPEDAKKIVPAIKARKRVRLFTKKPARVNSRKR